MSVYEVTAAEEGERFEFKLPGQKKTFSLPPFDFLEGDQLEVVAPLLDRAHLEEIGGVKTQIEVRRVMEDLSGADLGKLRSGQLLELWGAWMSAGEVGPGESGSSES